MGVLRLCDDDPVRVREATPTGTVTFLFTDVEGSTELWDKDASAMERALEHHDEVLRSAIEARDGFVFTTAGDSFAAAFDRADSAALAAMEAQSQLAGVSAALGCPLRVRMGLHTGTAQLRNDDYFGAAVNRAARVMGLGHGGQVLASTSTADLLRDHPDVIQLRDLGEHLLTGLDRPEVIWQLGAPGDSVDFGPLRSAGTRAASSLPRYANSFLGRRAELDELVEAVSKPGLVTLVGPGGIGKTRLSVEAAWEIQLDRTCYFLALAPVRDPVAVGHALMSAVGATPLPGLSPLEATVERLRDSSGLLIVDNCEHVEGAARTAVGTLVSECRDLSVLATSRAPLHVAGERTVVIGSLGQEAVSLFVDRAAASGASLDASAEAPAVEELCERLDGMPLAIELAAARARALSPTELRDRLDDRFRLLRDRASGDDDHHRSLQATVAWSTDLLDERSRALLARLAVFAGWVDLALIESVCSDEYLDDIDVVDHLADLVDQSLVDADRSGEVTTYRLLETTKAFASSELEPVIDPMALRDAHAHEVLKRLTALMAGLRGRHEGDSHAQVELVWPEIRAAVEHALATRNAALAVDLVAVFGTLAAMFEWAEVGDWADAVLELDGMDHRPNACEFLIVAAFFDWTRGRFDTGVPKWERARELNETRGTPVGYDLGTANGGFLSIVGRPDQGWRESAAAADALRESGDFFAAGSLYGMATLLLSYLGQVDQAAQFHQRTLEMADRCSAPGLAGMIHMPASVMCLDTDPERALDHAEQAMAYGTESGATWWTTTAANYRNAALVRVGDPHDAITELIESLERLRQSRPMVSISNIVRNTVALLDRLGAGREAAPLIGFLRAQPFGIPGSPGMREQPEQLAERLAATMGHDEAAAAITQGEHMTRPEVIDLALAALGQLQDPTSG
jgi:predicted ATPase/class 3 adenylate cyclase